MQVSRSIWILAKNEFQFHGIDAAEKVVANRVQLTSDGHRAYLEAVEGAFGGDVDYAQLVKLYGATSEGAKESYSPAECIGARKERIEAAPIPSTSRLATPSGRTSPCGCRCAALPG
jgi:hypothetical protein